MTDHPRLEERREVADVAMAACGSTPEALALLDELRERLGADSPHLADPFWETTPRGRVVVHAGGLRYWRDERDGQPIACRERGGRAEFGAVLETGELHWIMAPLGQVSQN